MHFLILGANGMLGRALQRAFAGEEVTAWDRAELDLTSEEDVAQKIPLLEPSVVINAAAYTDVDGAEENAEEAEAVNGYAVGNLAVTCADAGIPLVHVSTDYVFDGTSADGYAEDAEPMNPMNAYGRSKLLGETLLRETGKDFWLVRTAWLYGPGGKHFVDAILRVSEGKSSVCVVDDQRGSPTYSRDLAAAIRSLVGERAPYGIYHLVNEGPATWADLGEEVFRCAGKTARVERVPSSGYPTKASRPLVTVLKNTKRPPLRPWREALAEYMELRRLGES